MMERRWESAAGGCSVRFAREEDCPAILAMIADFARYLKLDRRPDFSLEQLRQALFVRRHAEGVVGEAGGEMIGYALFYPGFDTFACRPGLFIEDLYVRDDARKRGHGRAFLHAIAAIALERGCCRIEWCCRDDNAPAVDFYRRHRATTLEGLSVYALDETGIRRLAGPDREEHKRS